MDTTAQRLDALMDRRRLDLGYTWKVIVDEAGVSYQTLGQLRKGKPVSDVTVARVERALQWGPGSIPSILAGGEPTSLPPEDGADPLTAPEGQWDGELAQKAPLEGDEELRWRDRAEGGRLFQYRAGGFEHTATLDAGTPPEEAVLLLRAQLAKRIHRMSGVLMDRPQRAPREV